jgi:hypothetical protein
MGEGPDRRRDAPCSFCGKQQSQVRKLVAGPGVFICDQCIELCMEVIREDTAMSEQGQPSPPAQGSGWNQRIYRDRRGLLGRLRDLLRLKPDSSRWPV